MSADTEERFSPFRRKMEEAGLPELVIGTFALQYRQWVEGHTGWIGRDHISPVESLPDADTFEQYGPAGIHHLPQLAVIKLNGGLGTTMGLQGPKSLLPVKEGLTFLDVIARQILALRERSGCAIPLVLMNSFSTRDASLARLEQYRGLWRDLPKDILQHRVPKILESDGTPATWPAQPNLEWCPPGHGDLYAALVTGGALSRLLHAGFRYAFISNADNLGGVVDERLLGYLVAGKWPFLMECADRTDVDRKGGHLARRKDGGLLLREIAQCPPEELDEFWDIALYRYFNTNNLWVDLGALDEVIRRHRGRLPLPFIRNRKTLDPRDPSSPRVVQIETAVGSAVALFEGAEAVRVARTRFLPVKNNDDWLALWSDAFVFDPDGVVRLNPRDRTLGPAVRLDPRFYGRVDDLLARFPFGPPSLVKAEALEVHGDVRFGRGVRAVGRVRVTARGEGQAVIADGAVLEGHVEAVS